MQHPRWIAAVCLTAVTVTPGRAAPRDGAQSVSPLPNLRMTWEIDGHELQINLEASTDGPGWVGFGVGARSNSGMKGADIVVCDSTGGVTDYHGLKNGRPTKDILQDWSAVSANYIDGKTLCVIRRPLQTDDEHEDYNIERGLKVYLFAYGNGEFAYHNSRRAHMLLDLFDVNDQQWTPPDDYGGSLELRNDNHLVLNDRGMEYFDQCHSLVSMVPKEQIVGMDMSLIRIEGLLDNKTKHLVHHFTVYASKSPCDGSSVHSRGKFMMFVWAPGAQPMNAPDGVGIRLGGKDGVLSLIVQTHFDNPKQEVGMRDRSGVRIHYTKQGQSRKIEMGVLQLGDPYVRKVRTTLLDGWCSITIVCPGSLTKKLAEPLHVIGHAHHMHVHGESMYTSVNGREVTASEFFNFNSQIMLPTNFTINPGDQLGTTCVYQVPNGRKVLMGYSSEDEMCIDYLLYYPRQDVLERTGGACGLGAGAYEQWPIAHTAPASRKGFGDKSSLNVSSQSCPVGYEASGDVCVRDRASALEEEEDSSLDVTTLSTVGVIAVVLGLGMVLARMQIFAS